MKQLLDTSLSLRRTNPEAKLWKFYMNLAGTVMPEQSVQQMAKCVDLYSALLALSWPAPLVLPIRIRPLLAYLISQGQ